MIEKIHVNELTECEVCPLVPAHNQGTNKASNDHDLIDKKCPEDCWPRHASSEEEVQEQQRSRNEPINVADIEDLTVLATDNRITAWVFDLDRCEPEVGSHGEVSNAGYEDDSRSDVVEHAIATLLAHGQANESKTGDAHGCADGKVQVRAMSCDRNVRCSAIDCVAFGKSVS